ncbi:hypothetical protein HOY80DRAFT_582548 [Tuber brumale]|nr:hypothetical protein HOY80DRAFT_582548 [Tuber brumale]
MISTLLFHPHHPHLLSLGPGSTLRLHHINGTTNPPTISLHLRNTPISSAHFHPSGTSTIPAGWRKCFHIWNLSTGHYPKGNPDIWLLRDAEVNGDIPHLPRRKIHGSRRQPRIRQHPECNDILVGLHRKNRRPGRRHILVGRQSRPGDRE